MFFWKPRIKIFTIDIDIDYDDEAAVFIATSQDAEIKGLVLEAKTPAQMQLYLSEVVPMLLDENHNTPLSSDSDYRLDINIKPLAAQFISDGRTRSLAEA